jgi:3-hydroxymyristoyl/3-hydroxydecanoyl-(acyl carrier protein) dehydratase
LLAAEGKLALNRRLRALLAATVEAPGLPRRWRYQARMPLDAQGKTTHALLLALFDEATGERPTLPDVRLLESAPLRVLLALRVPPELLYFDGHFKDAPVLPGVALVDWAIHYGRAHFALPPRFHAVLALKFQQMIRPGQMVSLELLHDQPKGSLAFRYFSEAGPHAGGRILFQ